MTWFLSRRPVILSDFLPQALLNASSSIQASSSTRLLTKTPARMSSPIDPPTTTREQRHNSKLGLQLFAFYFAFYFSFVAINAMSPSMMEWQPWGGLNLALLYGFGLIVLALILAFVYGMFAQSAAATDSSATSSSPHSDDAQVTR